MENYLTPSAPVEAAAAGIGTVVQEEPWTAAAAAFGAGTAVQEEPWTAAGLVAGTAAQELQTAGQIVVGIQDSSAGLLQEEFEWNWNSIKQILHWR